MKRNTANIQRELDDHRSEIKGVLRNVTGDEHTEFVRSFVKVLVNPFPLSKTKRNYEKLVEKNLTDSVTQQLATVNLTAALRTGSLPPIQNTNSIQVSQIGRASCRERV